MFIYVHVPSTWPTVIPGRIVNTDQIQRVDPTRNDESIITFANGQRLRVSESVQAIDKLQQYARKEQQQRVFLNHQENKRIDAMRKAGLWIGKAIE